MATSSSEPPPKHVKLRYRALAYVRRIGRHRQPARPRASSQRSFADTTGARPSIEINSQRRFSDSDGPRPAVDVTRDGPRPIVHLGSRRSFIDSGARNRMSFVDSKGSKLPEQSVYFDSTQAEVKINTRSRRTSRARKKLRKARGKRQRFLASIHDHGGHRFRLFCGCCIEQEAFNPGDSPSFHWGVGFDDSYYHTPNYQRLSKGTRFRLGLCGLYATSRREAVDFVDLSSVGAKAASFDSGFGFTCSSPVTCPPPLGLVPARALPTTLQLLSRNGTDSGNFSGNGFSSTGFKRKVSSKSSGYPSYAPNTPPSPFMNDLAPTGTFNTTRTRSRVSVGCNGWVMNDNDPTITGWHRSGEVQPTVTQLEQVAEASDTEFDRESPKRYKRSPSISGATNGLSSPSASSPKLSLTPRLKPSSSRVSIVLLSQDGSISSSNGERGWFENSGIALVPLPASPIVSRSSLVPQTYDSGLVWHEESRSTEQDESGSPTKHRSSNSSGEFGFETEEVRNLYFEKSQSSRENTSLTTRFSASLRLTRSHSPRTMRRALRSHGTNQSRRVFQLGSRSRSPPSTPARMGSKPSMIFIDCPTQSTQDLVEKLQRKSFNVAHLAIDFWAPKKDFESNNEYTCVCVQPTALSLCTDGVYFHHQELRLLSIPVSNVVNALQNSLSHGDAGRPMLRVRKLWKSENNIQATTSVKPYIPNSPQAAAKAIIVQRVFPEATRQVRVHRDRRLYVRASRREGLEHVEPYQFKTNGSTTDSKLHTMIRVTPIVHIISDEDEKLHVGEIDQELNPDLAVCEEELSNALWPNESMENWNLSGRICILGSFNLSNLGSVIKGCGFG